MLTNSYNIRTRVKILGSFDEVVSGNPIDPNVVTLLLIDPDGIEVAYVFNGSGPIVKDSVGRYHALFVFQKSGLWVYKWTGVGVADVTSNDGQLFVVPSDLIVG